MTYASARTTRLLCVDDNADDIELLQLALERAAPARAWLVQRVEEAEAFAAALEQPVDLVLCDYHLPRFSPVAALKMLQARDDPPPLVVVTRAIGEQAAVDLLRQGAQDYVTKDRLATLPQVIDRVLEARARAREQARLAAELATAHARLREMSARLVAAQEDERARLARELHDSLGQAMAGMMLHLHAARQLKDADKANAHTDIALSMAQGVVDQLKTLSFALRPAQLNLLGLATTVETAVQELAGPAGIPWSVSTRGAQDGDLGDRAPLAVRVVREAVRQAVSGSGARQLRVRLRFLPGHRLAVAVSTCGGHAPAAASGELQALQERCELAGGSLRMRGCDGNGATVRAML
ncbi:histidine kinase [Ramlibacter sp. MAHUQ-53]|uniref:hybrid sensor histidine kinase/response regulator n=1 Tax=unclassified Ramlibacter TaxID=2617605 RepID=UPI00363FC178